MLKSIFLFAALSLLTTEAYALSAERVVSAEEVERFFKEENHRPRTRSIQVVNAHANLDFAFGFADGRYALAKYKIKKIRPNIYALGLAFQKKKGLAVYSQNFATFFWFDGGNQIVFKDGERKKVYDVQRGWHVEKRDTASGHDLNVTPRTEDIKVQLSHAAGTVYLTLALN